MSGKKADLLVRHAGQLVTVAGHSVHPKRGQELTEIGIISDGAVAVSDGVIIAIGPTAEVEEQLEIDDSCKIINADGKVVLPGLVDPHTHLVFAGSREHEL